MKRSQLREQRERLTSARRELSDVRSSLNQAYTVFNSTVDPDMLESSILEISALESKYCRMLRDLKKISEA